MIAKIAVSAATFAIDKPYSYRFSEEMALSPGMRVMIPFGRSNRHTEGVVLSVEAGAEDGLKPVSRCLDDGPVLSAAMLRLAAKSKTEEKPICVTEADMKRLEQLLQAE